MKLFRIIGLADNGGVSISVLIYLVCGLLLVPGSVKAGELLASQNFENSGWESQFTGEASWGDNITTTTSNPRSGALCLRWNQDDHRTDPITKLVGIGNSLLDWRGGINLPDKTPNELYFSMWFRHDDYSNDASVLNSSRKLFYFVDKNYNVGAMYIKFQLGTRGLNIAYANGAYSNDWARENWGYTDMSMNAEGVGPSTSGVWHKLGMLWDYDGHYMMMWLDGTLLLPQDPRYKAKYPEHAAAGRVIWDPDLTLHAKGMQIMYYDSDRDLVNGRDGNGFYSGIQIDDLEFWDGFPGDQGPPGQPTDVHRVE